MNFPFLYLSTLSLLPLVCTSSSVPSVQPLINRQNVVERHNIIITATDLTNVSQYDVLAVGNGAIVFNTGIDALQTFNTTYHNPYDLNILADWGWHTQPWSTDDPTYALRQYNFSYVDTLIDGNFSTRPVPYYMGTDGYNNNTQPGIDSWIMNNPHKISLGQYSLRWYNTNDNHGDTTTLPISMDTLHTARIVQNMWEGTLVSNFILNTTNVGPVTDCDIEPEGNTIIVSCGDANQVIETIDLIYYGMITGSCPSSFTMNTTCQSTTAPGIVQALCYNQSSCSITVNNDALGGDPCHGFVKHLAINNVTCRSIVPPITPITPLNVTVTSLVHPDVDMIGTRIQWSLINTSSATLPPLALRLAFSYGTGTGSVNDWSDNGLSITTIVQQSLTNITFMRILDSDSYRIDCSWSNPLWTIINTNLNAFDLIPFSVTNLSTTGSIDFMCLFTPGYNLSYPVGKWMPWMQEKIASTLSIQSNLPLSLDTVAPLTALMWSTYWTNGAFLDLASNTDDPRAFELERRMILSQYLLRIHNAGAEPPAETGLLGPNAWSNKHHLEMRFWHHTHWLMWNRPDLLYRSNGFYIDLLPNVTAYAQFQGYKGARWLKETASVMNRTGGIDVKWLGSDYASFPFGNPDDYGTLLTWEAAELANAAVVWQQPHPIWIADLHRQVLNSTNGSTVALAFMQEMMNIVFDTADYLSTRVYFNSTDNSYWLGPPILGAEEMGGGMLLRNPGFELVYFALALDIANEWKNLLNQPVNPVWSDVATRMSKPYVDPGANPDLLTYSFNYDCACVMNISTYCPSDRFGKVACRPLTSHPSMVGLFGMINGRKRGDVYGVNLTILNNTVYYVVNNWGWGNLMTATNVWGWDFPFTAMAMTRLQWSTEAIINFLLLPVFKNTYLPNGHNFQGNGLPAYLPGNGGILLALSLLAGGTSDNPNQINYFPTDWQIQSEGFVVPYP